MASIRVGPELIRLVGRRQYRGKPPVIAVRELLQNSVDAVLRTNKNVTPESIHITVTLHETDFITVRCDDLGCGMDEDTVKNKFLYLGNSDKLAVNDKSTGGFGIAKAAIMSGKWSMHSHDIFTSEDFMASSPEDVYFRQEKYRTGTVVESMYDFDKYYINEIINGIYQMIFLSVPRIKFTFIDQRAGATKTFNDAGFPTDAESKIVQYGKVDNGKTQWSGSLVKQFENSNYIFRRCNVYRINGLVQWVDAVYADRSEIAIIDITTDRRPQDDDYPLTTSREGLANPDLRREIDNWLRTLDVNPLTTKRIMNQPDSKPADIHLKFGYIRGKRGESNKSDQELEKARQIFAAFTAGSLQEWVARQQMADIGFSLLDFKTNPPDQPDNDDEKYSIYYQQFKSKSWDHEYRIIEAWKKALELVVDSEEEFGIGLTGEKYTCACRLDGPDGHPYYLINPSLFNKVSSRREIALVLWTEACHEATHALYENHDENFTSHMGWIMRVTSSAFLEAQSDISEALEGVRWGGHHWDDISQ